MICKLAFALILKLVASAEDDHSGHAHGGKDAFEWAGIFETPGDSYTWSAQKTDGKNGLAYADATMKLAAIPVAFANEAKLHQVEAEGNHALGLDCTDVQTGGTITPMEDKCYKLVFSQDQVQSLYKVNNAAGSSAVAFFTEHFPTEFEKDAHYFKDKSGADIEPVAQLPEAAGGHDGHDHGSKDGGEHDGHDHGAFEWAGIFDTPGDSYTWTAQKTEGKNGMAYVDPAMKLAVLPAAKADDATLHKLEKEGEHALEMKDCTDVHSGDTITPMEDKCYRLVFSEHDWQSLYRVKATGAAALAFFTEHYPTEFENDAHYLKDPIGADIEPVAELPEGGHAGHDHGGDEEEEDKPWGSVLGSAIIINLITLVGVVMTIPGISRAVNGNFIAAQGIICGFAAGAILACAFFLLLFESTHLIAGGWDTEVAQLWRWGTVILAGILLPGVIECCTAMVSGPSEDKDMAKATPGERARLFMGVNLGDFFHNMCDGFFLAAAFKGCGTTFGWRVATGTILHEIPQELADYVILTGPRMGLSPVKALVCNFISGLGVVVGSIIVLALDIENDAIGLLLAFGGGVYIHVGATECMPKMYASELSPGARTAAVVAFIIGAVLIGLILLDHEHCIPPTKPGEEPVDPHAGHNH